MDILTIGEVLIDLTQTGKDARGIPQFAANPGGAPANLAVAASRLGAQTAFIGKVGADAFGRYLKEVLAENKVDVSGMAVDADHPTTMAVVSVDATGERDFSFYRSANADVMLCKEDISDEALKAAKIVHFGSVSLTADPSRTATLDAAARAKKLGAVITYDPNYRANLWKNKEDAIAQMKAPLPLVDILKVSDEELPLLTGTTDCESGTAQLAQNGIRLFCQCRGIEPGNHHVHIIFFGMHLCRDLQIFHPEILIQEMRHQHFHSKTAGVGVVRSCPFFYFFD